MDRNSSVKSKKTLFKTTIYSDSTFADCKLNWKFFCLHQALCTPMHNKIYETKISLVVTFSNNEFSAALD